MRNSSHTYLLATGVVAAIIACQLPSIHAQFQDEIPLPAGGVGKAPVFQDEVQQPAGDGKFGEVKPGVFAPKNEAPLRPPRRPFMFDHDQHLEAELRETYLSLCGDARTLQFKDFDMFVRKLLNPADLTLYDEEEEALTKALTSFKTKQGLNPEAATSTLYLGFVSRGAPLKFIRKLNKQLLSIRNRLREEYIKNGRADIVKKVEGASMAAGDGKKPIAMFEDEVEGSASQKGVPKKSAPRRPAPKRPAPKAPAQPPTPASLKTEPESPAAQEAPRRVRLDMSTGRKSSNTGKEAGSSGNTTPEPEVGLEFNQETFVSSGKGPTSGQVPQNAGAQPAGSTHGKGLSSPLFEDEF